MKIKFIYSNFFLKKEVPKFIMRVFIMLFCTTVFGLSSVDILSQNAKVYIEKDKTITVDEVFNIIRAQTDYTFLYHEDMFKDFPLVPLKKGTIKANKLLKSCFSVKDFQFDLTSNNTIIIKKNKKRLLTSSENSIQQTVTGTIKDKDGLLLAGVTVLVKGTTRGVSTDFDGNYFITVNQGDVLSFSYIGYATQEIIVEDKVLIDVVLQENVNKLDGVIVSTGYQKISKERATGSFAKINEKTLGIKTAQNISSKIEGEVAGVLFDGNDGVIIRGLSSISSTVNDRGPLIVVDGFPISQGLETINPNDVESITVLKDAAAASIWGIRAANGVIVIVTNKGNKNTKPNISYSNSYAITSQIDLHDQPYASTESFLEFEKHQADNGWARLPGFFRESSISEGLNTYLLLNLPDTDSRRITQAQADNIINGLSGIDSRGQFEDLFLSNETWMQHNLSIDGGGENSSYQASLVYNENKNVNSFSNNDNNQIIANISNQIEISPKLTFTGRINYSLRNDDSNDLGFSNGMSIDNAERLNQYQNILDENGNRLVQHQTYYNEFKEARSVENGYPYNWDYNLLDEFENRDNESKNTEIRLVASLNYKITDYLDIEGRYQYEQGNRSNRNLFNENTYFTRNLVNLYTSSSGGVLTSAIPKGSVLDFLELNSETQSGRLQLNFNKSFNDKHNVTAIAGYEVRKVLSGSNNGRYYGYNPESLAFARNLDFSQQLPTVLGFRNQFIPDIRNVEEEENRFISYYGNFAYTYDKKYTFNGSIRLDDTNLFGASDEFKNIPLFSVGAKWAIHNEDFFNSNTINNLALRATYGSNGNVDSSASPFVQAGVATSLDGNEFAFISNPKNPELRLERVFVTNLGLDFGMFNNRLSGSIEYYERKSQDLLSNVTFPSILGFNSALINAGNMENKGIDITLSGLIVNSKNFKYNSTLNFGYNKNTVTKVDVPQETPFAYTVTQEPLLDRPLNYLFSYQFEGLNDEGDPVFLDENGNEVSDGIINSVDALKYEGTTTPKIYGGWINQFSYKSFTLRALTTFQLGHVFRNTNALDYPRLLGFNANNFIHKDFENRWQNPGDEATTDIPRIPTSRVDATTDTYTSHYRYGSQSVDDASHIRLREVVLNYDLNEKITSLAGFSRLSIGLQATNLALINFNKWDVDPQNLIFKLRPTFTLSLNANF